MSWNYRRIVLTFGKFFRSYSELLSKFGAISFQEYVSKGITHPVFYGDLVYKLRRVKNKPNFISSGSNIVKRLRRRQYYPMIIERTICLCLTLLQPSSYHSLSVALWLTRRLVLYDGPCLNLFRGDRVLIPVPSVCYRNSLSLWTWARVQTVRSTGPELAYRLCVAHPTLMDVPIYFWFTFIFKK